MKQRCLPVVFDIFIETDPNKGGDERTGEGLNEYLEMKILHEFKIPLHSLDHTFNYPHLKPNS